MPAKRFDDAVLAAVDKSLILGIRAGTKPHRIIGIWAVVVERRVFVRSWSMKPRSWYRTFLEEPQGVMEIGGRQFRVRAVRTRSERLKDAVDRAYERKYHTPASMEYVRDFRKPERRNTTTELVPL
ncbi:MAG TPA: DUF2255 family protein [Thermoanaerobaculia bacterium]|nr:DUF2255 family protein [Thermoanaerobaculia bacterium]